MVTEPGNKYRTTAVVDDIISWLDESADQPSFAWVGFLNLHTPIHLPPTDLHTFKDLPPLDLDKIKLPNVRDPKYDDYLAAMLQALDTEVGRLLDHIASDVDRETFVILVGDNGTASIFVDLPFVPAEGQSTGKGSLHKTGFHVPLLVLGPEIDQPGRRVPHITHVVDIYDTIIDLAGGKDLLDRSDYPTRDSRSLAGFLRDAGAVPVRRSVMVESGRTGLQRSEHVMFDGRYKLHIKTNIMWMYDVVADPGETVDLLRQSPSEDIQSNARRLFADFMDIYMSERNPYSFIDPFWLLNRYNDMLCKGPGKTGYCRFAG